MKMMDVWLLFNLIIPFVVVLTPTYMDTLMKSETEDDDDDEVILSRHEMEQKRQKNKGA